MEDVRTEVAKVREWMKTHIEPNTGACAKMSWLCFTVESLLEEIDFQACKFETAMEANIEALSDLAKTPGFIPSKMWGEQFNNLLKVKPVPTSIAELSVLRAALENIAKGDNKFGPMQSYQMRNIAKAALEAAGKVLHRAPER